MKKGFFASEKYIIGIREYMEVFLKTTYSWRGKLTHKKLNEFLTDKGYALPKRSHFDELGTEDVLTGNIYLVKDEVGKIIPYKSRRLDLKQILSDLNKNAAREKERRLEILKEQGLKETKYGTIIKKGIVDPEEYDDLDINGLGSLLINNNRVKRLVNRRINH